VEAVMPRKKRTKSTLSISGKTYARLRKRCDQLGITVAECIRLLTADLVDPEIARPLPITDRWVGRGLMKRGPYPSDVSRSVTSIAIAEPVIDRLDKVARATGRTRLATFDDAINRMLDQLEQEGSAS
jgi:hypothetical protein